MIAVLNFIILLALRIVLPLALMLFIGEKVRKQQYLQML
jgi:hypothetical protein